MAQLTSPALVAQRKKRMIKEHYFSSFGRATSTPESPWTAKNADLAVPPETKASTFVWLESRCNTES